MAIRSMTGFAQLKGQHGKTGYTFTAKSVNHRFLDLHLRLPGRSELFEQRLRKLFKEKMHRGHVELTLTLEYAGAIRGQRQPGAGLRLCQGLPRAVRRTRPARRSPT